MANGPNIFSNASCFQVKMPWSLYSQSCPVCFVATYQGVSPRFIVQPVDKLVAEGATVVLYCAANGRNSTGGRPSVIWLKDGAALDLA